jgi:hypothetical protein
MVSRSVTCPLVQGSAGHTELLFLRSGCIPSICLAGNHSRGIGDPMARYISQHTLACLTRQGAEELSKRMQGGAQVSARRVLVNMQEGKMLVEFDAPGREELEQWLALHKFHFDWLLRIEFESTGAGPLQSV